jgi:hypothetical protein
MSSRAAAHDPYIPLKFVWDAIQMSVWKISARWTFPGFEYRFEFRRMRG